MRTRLAVALALGIVACSSSDDPGTPSDAGSTPSATTTAGDDSSPEAICVQTINAFRATKGLPAYTRWNAIESCSDGEAKSDGSSSSAHGAFGTCKEMAQNECPGWPGPAADMIPKCLQAMWAMGPGEGHYDTMASTKYTQVACGFADGAGGVWAVQNFK